MACILSIFYLVSRRNYIYFGSDNLIEMVIGWTK